MTTKQQFLLEHNKLSPFNMQATLPLLTKFKEDKMTLFKSEDWPVDKLRRPFILWLTSSPTWRKENLKGEERGAS